MMPRNYEIGTELSFDYDKNGVNRPSNGILLRVQKMASGYLIVMLDKAQRAERSFWEHKMTRVGAWREIASNLPFPRAQGLADGSTGEGILAAAVLQKPARVTHGLDRSYAVWCVRDHRKTA